MHNFFNYYNNIYNSAINMAETSGKNGPNIKSVTHTQMAL